MEKKHQAKRDMLKKLREIMGGMGAESAMGPLGVTVKAKDKEGLLEGLSKAEEIVEKGNLPESDDKEIEDHEELEDHDEDMEDEDYEDMSKEELIELLKKR